MSTTSSAEKRREASPDDRFGLCMHDFLRGWRDDTDNRLAVGWEASAKFWDQSHSVLKKRNQCSLTRNRKLLYQGDNDWIWPSPTTGRSLILKPSTHVFPRHSTEYSVSDLSSKLNFKTRDNLSKWQCLFDWQVPLNCHHGRRVGSVCVCNEGWKTKTNNVPKKDLRYIYDWCNVKIEKSKRAYQRALMQAVSFTLKHFISTEFLTTLL